MAKLMKMALCTAFVTFSLIGAPIQAHAAGHVKVFDGTGGYPIVDTPTPSEQMTDEQMTDAQEDQATSERPREAYFVNVDHGTTTQ